MPRRWPHVAATRHAQQRARLLQMWIDVFCLVADGGTCSSRACFKQFLRVEPPPLLTSPHSSRVADGQLPGRAVSSELVVTCMLNDLCFPLVGG